MYVVDQGLHLSYINYWQDGKFFISITANLLWLYSPLGFFGKMVLFRFQNQEELVK